MKKSKFIFLVSLLLVNMFTNVSYASHGNTGWPENPLNYNKLELKIPKFRQILELRSYIEAFQRYYGKTMYSFEQSTDISKVTLITGKRISGGKEIKSLSSFKGLFKDRKSEYVKPYVCLLYNSEHNFPINFRVINIAFNFIDEIKNFNSCGNFNEVSVLWNGYDMNYRMGNLPKSLSKFMNRLNSIENLTVEEYRIIINDILMALFDIRVFYQESPLAREGLVYVDGAISAFSYVKDSIEIP